MAPRQLSLEIRFYRMLRRRQKGTDRIVNQSQTQARALAPISQRIKLAQRLNRFGENARAPLRVGLLIEIVRKAGHDLYLVSRQKSRKIGLRGQQQNGEVTTVHHVSAE